MGGIVSSSAAPVTQEDMDEVKKGILDVIKQNKVVIFSKVYCPYCVDAKKCFDKLNVKYTTIELNNHPQGSLVQDVLMEMTGARTVPRVFINGNCIGGGSDTVALYQSGKLQEMVGC